jgi:protein-S-isoprenylcysteine O-methyltransferase Ste14
MVTSRKNKKTKRVDASDWMTNLIVLGFVVIFTLAGLVLLVAFMQVNVLTCTRLEPSLLFIWCPLLLLAPGLLLLIRTVKKIGARFTLFRNVHKPMARPR